MWGVTSLQSVIVGPHNTHMLAVVKVLSRRDGAGSAVEHFLRPALKGNGEMCSVDMLDMSCNDRS